MTNCKNYFDNETHTINTLIDKECLNLKTSLGAQWSFS